MAPSDTLDKHLTTGQVITMMNVQLGVDVRDGGDICRFCGACLDIRGIHDASCMAGGDHVHMHNEVRDITFEFSARARLHPALERAGLLDDPAVFLNLRRPADVLIDDMRAARGLEPLTDLRAGPLSTLK